MKLSEAETFVVALAAAFLLPLAIPRVGLDFQYFFIMVIVLLAWFIIKWDAVKAIRARARLPEVALGLAIVALDYGYNYARVSNVGVIDMIAIFVGIAVANYGFRSLRKFWVPLAYGLVLLAGYQIEAITPNYTALQDWLASTMTTMVNALGIGATVSGDLVTMPLANGTPVVLEMASSCTGLQGILAFGMLSTMTLLDMKPKASRLVPIFVAGFAGAFLINIVRLLVVFMTFEYFGVAAGTTMHVYFGYLIFVAWIMVFWALAFRYLVPRQGALPPALSRSAPPGIP